MGRYDLSEEATATDEELSDAMSNLGALSEERIAELLPDRADQDELKELIAAVNAAADENRKKAILSERLAVVSSVVKEVALRLV